MEAVGHYSQHVLHYYGKFFLVKSISVNKIPTETILFLQRQNHHGQGLLFRKSIGRLSNIFITKMAAIKNIILRYKVDNK